MKNSLFSQLKHFFIPHQGNDYKPHSIRHEHLLFHAFIAIVLKGFLFSAVFALPSTYLMASDAASKQAVALFSMTNAIRSSLSLPPLSQNSLLIQAAKNKANHMAVLGYFSHYGPDGKQHVDWLNDIGYPYAVSGENLAVGFSTAEGVMSGWRKSQTHYANMIDPVYKEMGVGVIPGLYKEKETHFVAQFFGVQKNQESPEGQVEVELAQKPLVNEKESYVSTAKVDGDLGFEAVVYAEPETTSVEVFVNDQSIALAQSKEAPNVWKGEQKIEEKFVEIPDPIVLATAVSKNDSGDISVQDVAIENIEPLLPGILQKYQFYKQNPSQFFLLIQNSLNGYYLLLTVFIICSLTIAIVVEMRKQHPHLIALSFGIASLLILLLRI